MAIQNYFPEDDQNKKFAASSVVSGNPNQQSSTQQGPTAGATTGTGFVNLQQYLGANQGQAGGLANTVIGNTGSDIDAFKKDADKVAKEAKQSYNDVAGATKSQELQKGLRQNAAANVQNVQDFLGSNYKAPETTQFTGGLTDKHAGLSGKLNMLDDRYTQQGILKNEFQKQGNNYTSGFGALDSFLLGADGQARGQIDQMKGRVGEVTGSYQTAKDQIGGYYQDGSTKYGANQKAVRDSIGSTYSDKKNDIRSFEDQAAQRNAAQQLAYQDALSKLQPALGGADASKYIKQGSAYNAHDLMSDDDLANLNALSSLAGENSSYQRGGGSDFQTLEGYQELIDAHNARIGQEAYDKEQAAARSADNLNTQQEYWDPLDQDYHDGQYGGGGMYDDIYGRG